MTAPATPIEAALSALLTAVDTASLAKQSFADLCGLFKAIHDLAPVGSTFRNLAHIGQYLAIDWSNLHECEQRQLDEKLDALRAMVSPEGQKAAAGS